MTAAKESAAIARLVPADPRFREDAYRLVLDGFYVARENVGRNVGGHEFLSGVVARAVADFGLVAPSVVASMGLRDAADVT